MDKMKNAHCAMKKRILMLAIDIVFKNGAWHDSIRASSTFCSVSRVAT